MGLPLHGWTCFHCGETFVDKTTAADHFGADEFAKAACVIKAGAERGILHALRDAERQAAEIVMRLESDGTDSGRAYRALLTRYEASVRAAEELGYERGLADGRQCAS